MSGTERPPGPGMRPETPEDGTSGGSHDRKAADRRIARAEHVLPKHHWTWLGESLGRAGAVDRYVREFHEAFGLPVRTTPVARPPESDLRTRLIEEEAREYYEAVQADDPVAVADALGDIAYVIYGAALTHGIDLDAVVAEIHRSNMTKLGEDGAPIRRDDGKILKGPRYEPPDLLRVIFPTHTTEGTTP